jgi:mono/diheme cytochrome c family protein
VATVLDDFEYPIRSGEMRPARETCEQCHTPEKFSDDSLRVINRHENNRSSDPYDIYLLMHTGGGSQREGLGFGIHWHIENPVTYIALDDQEQEIPWVQVETADGEVIEYNALNSPIDTDNLDQYAQHEMDCITCHNRIAHAIQNPTNVIDNALNQGDLSRDIPFIRTRAIELLTPAYPSREAARVSFSTMHNYYRENYPEFYAEGKDEVERAIELLVSLYEETNYPEQELTWDTHPNNIGHLEAPGCFRCHDGQHFNEQGEAIRLECNLCHSIPQVVRPADIEPEIPLTTGIEPASHLDSTWISQHHNVFDASCANCHTIGNPGGIDDSSFCSNSVCHGAEWEYAGFDAPGLATVMGIYQVEPAPLLQDFEGEPTYDILQPVFAQECGGCHGPVPSKGLRVTDYAGLMAGSDGGPVIEPGSPDESMIIETLSSGHFGQFTEHQMMLLREWIANGAPES